jgi:hypothetical protein
VQNLLLFVRFFGCKKNKKQQKALFSQSWQINGGE